MANQLENISQGLQAFGAGIGGNLAQHQQVQMQRKQQEQQMQEQMLEKRAQAAYQDAYQGLQFAQSDNYDGVLSLAVNRLETLKNFPDADPSDSQRIAQLSIAARNGDEQAQKLLKQELGAIVNQGQAFGYLQAPKKSESKVVGAGDALVSETGEELYRAPEAPKKPSQRDEKIAALAGRLRGSVDNPEELATQWVDGVLDVEILDSGFVRLIDGEAVLRGEGDKAVYELPINALQGAEEVETPDRGLYEMADETPGFSSGAQEVYGRVANQFGLPAPENTMEARQTLRMAGQELVRALQQNPRYSEGERKAIAEEISIGPSVFDSPASLRSRMRSIDTNLRRRLRQEESIANDPQMPEDARAGARVASTNIENFLNILQVPQMPDEITLETIEPMDATSARRMISNMSDEELDNLPDDVYEALRSKF